MWSHTLTRAVAYCVAGFFSWLPWQSVVDAAEGGEGRELPAPAAEFPGQALTPEAQRLRPVVQRTTEYFLMAVMSGHLSEQLDTNMRFRDQTAYFFKVLDQYFKLLYGVPRSGNDYISFYAAGRDDSLRGMLDIPEVRALMVVYLEVAAGDMGRDALIWNEEQRTFAKRGFQETLKLLRRAVAEETLGQFLRRRENQYWFYKFYLSLLRRTASISMPLLPFDDYVTSRLRHGHLASDLETEGGREQLLSRLTMGNSILTSAGVTLPPEPSPSVIPPPQPTH